jgi:hypothetical protein
MRDFIDIWQIAGYVVSFGIYLAGTAYLASQSKKPRRVWTAGFILIAYYAIGMILNAFGLVWILGLITCAALPILWSRYIKPSGWITFVASLAATLTWADGAHWLWRRKMPLSLPWSTHSYPTFAVVVFYCLAATTITSFIWFLATEARESRKDSESEPPEGGS